MAESDYNGGIALDATNADHVVISSTLDPTTNASNARFSLYEGHSSPLGETWQRVSNTGQDALRPTFTIRGGVLLWFAGSYSSYRTFKTSVDRLS